MKGKPDTSRLPNVGDVNSFLDNGAADAADRAPAPLRRSPQQPTDPIAGKVHREQKVFRLPLQLINTLKREAYERSVATGSRVTETELVEQALTEFFDR